MAKKKATKKASRRTGTRKKAGRKIKRTALCDCSNKPFAKQRATCPQGNCTKPKSGWRETSGDTTTAETPAVDLIALTAETIQRLANATDEITLDTFKEKPELTLEAILADERCSDWIKIDYDEGEFAKKLKTISDADYQSLKENTGGSFFTNHDR